MRSLFSIALVWSLTTAAAAQATQNESTKLSTGLAPPDEAARPMFETGRRAFEAGRYAEALDAFQRVFVLTGHPAMLINIANTHARLGEHKRAAASLEQYLALMPEAPDRLVLEARIAALYNQPDEAALPPAPPPPPAPAGRLPSHQAPPPTAAEADRPSGFIAGRTFTWVALGSSIAFAAAAGLVWLDANQNFERLALTCGVDGVCSDAQVDSVRGGVTAANVCLAGAGLSLAAAAILFFAEGPTESAAPRVTAGFDGRGASISLHGRL